MPRHQTVPEPSASATFVPYPSVQPSTSSASTSNGPVRLLTAKEPALTQIRADLAPARKTSPYSSGVDVSMQLKLTERSNGSKHKEQALKQIRDQLLPYAGQNPGNTDTLSSESSSGTVNSDPSLDPEHHEAVLITALVGLGYEKDMAICALKLTQFRGIKEAMELLNRHGFGQPLPQDLIARASSLSVGVDNGCLSDSSRSDSPRVPSPFGQQNMANRTPSPLARQAIHITPQLPPSGARTPAAFSPAALPPPRRGGTRIEVGAPAQDYALRPSGGTLQQPVVSHKVPKPQVQLAGSPTVISIKAGPVHPVEPGPSQPTRVLSAHLDPAKTAAVKIAIEPRRTADGNYVIESTNSDTGDKIAVQTKRPIEFSSGYISQPGSVHSIVVGGDEPVRSGGDGYISNLLAKVDTILAPRGSLTSTESSESSLPVKSFQQMMSGARSPLSSSLSVSTESSNECSREQPPHRCGSPLPPSIRQRLDEGSYVSVIKPCTPEAFRFFMEQHIENVLKQGRERQKRLMQLNREMDKATLPVNWKKQMLTLLAQKESKYLRSKRQRLGPSMFEKIKEIGVGAFGEVALVRKKDTDSLYAMKTLRKKDVIKLDQLAHVKAERDILAEANSEWIVKLFYSFQDEEKLFFIMEYIPGGDMMSLLIKKEIFDENLARFYIAELVCAIESVHRLGFIHRDIKPDNILIDLNGHIKLTDFGLCTGLRWTHDKRYYSEHENGACGHSRQDSFDLLREEHPGIQHKLLSYRNQQKRNKAHSVVGTCNYMAPEVHTKSGHTQLCDWWSVGVILYEMVVGCPPFYAESPAKTREKVLKWWQYLSLEGGGKPPLNPPVKDLIQQLCCAQEDRLGQRGADEIKRHPFFAGVDFAHLRECKAPYVPKICHPTDTSHFDPVQFKSENSEQFLDTLTKREKKNGSNPAFFEFTFRHFFDMDPSGCPILRQSSRPSLGPLIEANSTSSNPHATHEPERSMYV